MGGAGLLGGEGSVPLDPPEAGGSTIIESAPGSETAGCTGILIGLARSVAGTWSTTPGALAVGSGAPVSKYEGVRSMFSVTTEVAAARFVAGRDMRQRVSCGATLDFRRYSELPINAGPKCRGRQPMCGCGDLPPPSTRRAPQVHRLTLRQHPRTTSFSMLKIAV